MELSTAKVHRREFLKNSAAGATGLVLGFYLPQRASAELAPVAAGAFAPNAWIRITPDDTITLVIDKSEMGQGVVTSLSMLLAEELECDWTKVRTEFAPADKAYFNPIFGMQGTGGSMSIRASWKPLSQAGASAREMLIEAAAQHTAGSVGLGCVHRGEYHDRPRDRDRAGRGRNEPAARRASPEGRRAQVAGATVGRGGRPRRRRIVLAPRRRRSTASRFDPQSARCPVSCRCGRRLRMSRMVAVGNRPHHEPGAAPASSGVRPGSQASGHPTAGEATRRPLPRRPAHRHHPDPADRPGHGRGPGNQRGRPPERPRTLRRDGLSVGPARPGGHRGPPHHVSAPVLVDRRAPSRRPDRAPDEVRHLRLSRDGLAHRPSHRDLGAHADTGADARPDHVHASVLRVAPPDRLRRTDLKAVPGSASA